MLKHVPSLTRVAGLVAQIGKLASPPGHYNGSLRLVQPAKGGVHAIVKLGALEMHEAGFLEIAADSLIASEIRL